MARPASWSGAGRRPKGLVVCPMCHEEVAGEAVEIAVADIELPSAHKPAPGARLVVHPGTCAAQMRAIVAYLAPRPPMPCDPIVLRRVKRAIAFAKRKP